MSPNCKQEVNIKISHPSVLKMAFLPPCTRGSFALKRFQHTETETQQLTERGEDLVKTRQKEEQSLRHLVVSSQVLG